MEVFSYYVPTEIVFGKGAESKAAALVKKYSGSRVLLVYGGGSVKKSGLLERVKTDLENSGLKVYEKGGISPNPLLSQVRDGIRLALEHKADFVLAVGGGSAIDAAKAIAHGAANPTLDVWSFWQHKAVVERSLPVGVILTISAAGSETSSSAVLTCDETKEKRGINTDFNRPKFALMNPELTYSVPKKQLACGVVDIFMHTFDRFFSNANGANVLTDAIAISLMRTVIHYGSKVLNNPCDYEAVSELMWCGSVSHTGLTGLGRTPDFSVHQLGHELSGSFDVPHGESLSAVILHWCKYVYKKDAERFAYLGKSVFDVESSLGNEEAALTTIEKIGQFFKGLDMPLNFSELVKSAISDQKIEAMAESCVFYGKRKVGVFCPLGKADIIAIYTMANQKG